MMPSEMNSPADLSHAGAVDKAIEYMTGQNIGAPAIIAILNSGSSAACGPASCGNGSRPFGRDGISRSHGGGPDPSGMPMILLMRVRNRV
jgi:hypothetical protein